ncbi:MAG: hypothetical protein QG617_724, partial [Campylobacterota bacterium]|nr:hypothetical protein [Campylobacterota bacterium]
FRDVFLVFFDTIMSKEPPKGTCNENITFKQ